MEPMQEKPAPDRITMRTFWLAILDMFNIEKGLPHTLIALSKYPGRAIRAYLFEDRQALVHPFRFVIFVAAIATFFTLKMAPNASFRSNDAGKSSDRHEYQLGKRDSATQDIKLSLDPRLRPQETDKLQQKFMNDYFNLLMLLGVPAMALGSFWVFRKRWNYAEHLVANCYIYGYSTVLYLLLLPISIWADYWAMSSIYMVISTIYLVYAYKATFQESWMRSILKTLLVFLISIMGFIVSGFVISVFFVLTNGIK